MGVSEAIRRAEKELGIEDERLFDIPERNCSPGSWSKPKMKTMVTRIAADDCRRISSRTSISQIKQRDKRTENIMRVNRKGRILVYLVALLVIAGLVGGTMVYVKWAQQNRANTQQKAVEQNTR